MLLTIKRADLIKKLEAAKAAKIETIKKGNASIEADYVRELKEQLTQAEKFVQQLKAGKQPGGYRDWCISTVSKRRKETEQCREFDGALALLRMAEEETVTIDTRVDKSGIAKAIAEAFS